MFRVGLGIIFLSKIEDKTHAFTTTWRTTCLDKSILGNIVACYQDRNPSQKFLCWWFNLQKSQEIASDGVTFKCKHRALVYSPNLHWTPPRVFLWGCFEIAAPKALVEYQAKCPVKQPTSTAYWTRNSTIDTFLEELREERVF